LFQNLTKPESLKVQILFKSKILLLLLCYAIANPVVDIDPQGWIAPSKGSINIQRPNGGTEWPRGQWIPPGVYWSN